MLDGVRISAGDILLRDDNKGKNIGGDAADGFPTRGKGEIQIISSLLLIPFINRLRLCISHVTWGVSP